LEKASKKSKKDKGKDGKKKGRGKGKDVVDPNKPKGPKGAYMCFVQIARPKINAAHPDMKFADIAKMLGEQWKSMDPETRTGYEKMAEQDKERYQREISAYVPMDAAGLETLRKEKAAKKSAGGLQKPYRCSPLLARFVGEPTVSRATLTSKMWAYFKSNNLMDPENKRWVIADDVLKELLGVDRFQGFTVSKYLSDHLLPME
jgi:chromatin remodeling complex protein RSC6